MKTIIELSNLSPKELSLLTEADFTSWIKGLIKRAKDKIGRGSIKTGDIIIYNYSAVGWENETLSFYDQFPCVIVTSVFGGYFTGFNIHYIPLRERKRLVQWLKDQYPKEFKTETKKPFPNFDYQKLAANFPFIADACIHKYIRNRASSISLLPPKELESLAWVDTSKFIFREDAKYKSATQLWKDWKNTKSFQARTQSRTSTMI